MTSAGFSPFFKKSLRIHIHNFDKWQEMTKLEEGGAKIHHDFLGLLWAFDKAYNYGDGTKIKFRRMCMKATAQFFKFQMLNFKKIEFKKWVDLGGVGQKCNNL